MKRSFLAVAAAALLILLIRDVRVGLAGDYVDPIGRILAQDEALYASSAIQMASLGGWLTPLFMGRYALYKPPLQIWAAAFWARVLGISRLSLRLPESLASALAVGLIFLWAAEVRSVAAGACAALLVASNHLWHVLGSFAMTDALLVAFSTAAMYALFCDPWMESRRALWGFAGAVAAAILTKSVAGVLPLASLGLYWMAAPARYRPRFARVCRAAGLALALAGPWFVYQLIAHHRWFWTEHVLVEILGFGTAAPPQTSHENQAVFYLMRLAILDPLLLALFVMAVPGLVRALGRQAAFCGPPAVLLVCWLAVPAASVLVWRYRNASYLLPLTPPLALAAAAYGPFSDRRTTRWLVALIALAACAKAATPRMPWGLSFAEGTVQPVDPIVSRYCARHRGNEFILVGADDDLYASALPLPRLRYCLVGAGASAGGPYAMDFAAMGITVTGAQFDDLERWVPAFRARLREWGLDSDAAVASLILAASPQEVAEMIRAHPQSDFLVPDRYRTVVEGAAVTHEIEPALPGHWLLLSREARSSAVPGWSCGL